MTEHYEDLAAMLAVELVVIDAETRLRELREAPRRGRN